jgi:hypothetical protein
MDIPDKALRIVSAIAGCGLIYTALFVYEDAQDKLQNHLERWWVQLRDQHPQALTAHTAFLRRIATTTESLFLRVFGHGSFTLNAFALSGSISFAAALLHHFDNRFLQPMEVVHHRYDFDFGIFFAVAPLVWIICRSVRGQMRCRSAILTAIVIYWLYSSWDGATRYLSRLAEGRWHPMPKIVAAVPIEGSVFLVVLGLSFLCDISFLFIVRRTLKAISSSKNSLGIVLLAIVPLLLGYFAIYGPLALTNVWYVFPVRFGFRGQLPQLAHYRDQFLFQLWSQFSPGRVADFNYFDFLIGALFFVVLATLLIHVIAWPVIEKPIYLLQELGIAKRRKLAAILGLACIVHATGSAHELFKSVLEVLS